MNKAIDEYMADFYEKSDDKQIIKRNLFWFYLLHDIDDYVKDAEQLLEDGLIINVKTRNQSMRISKIDYEKYAKSIIYDLEVTVNLDRSTSVEKMFDHFVANGLLDQPVETLQNYVIYFTGHTFIKENIDDLEKFLNFFDAKFDTNPLVKKFKMENLVCILKTAIQIVSGTTIETITIMEQVIEFCMDRYHELSYDFHDEIDEEYTLPSDATNVIIGGRTKMLDVFAESKNFKPKIFHTMDENIYFELFIYFIRKYNFQININYYFEKIMPNASLKAKFDSAYVLRSGLVNLEINGCLQKLIDMGLDLTCGSVTKILLDIEPSSAYFDNIGQREVHYFKQILKLLQLHSTFWEDNRASVSAQITDYLVKYVVTLTKSDVIALAELGIDFGPTLYAELQKPFLMEPLCELRSTKKLWQYFMSTMVEVPFNKGANKLKVFCACIHAKRKDLAVQMLQRGIIVDPFADRDTEGSLSSESVECKRDPCTKYLTKKIFKNYLLEYFAPEFFEYHKSLGFEKKDLVPRMDFRLYKNTSTRQYPYPYSHKKIRTQRMILERDFVENMVGCINQDNCIVGKFTLSAIFTKPDFDEKYLCLISPSILKYLDSTGLPASATLGTNVVSVDYQQLLEYMMEFVIPSSEPIVLVIEYLKAQGASIDLLFDKFKHMLLENTYGLLGTNDVYFPIIQEWLEFVDLKVDDLIEKLYADGDNLSTFNTQMLLHNNSLDKYVPNEINRSPKLVESIATKTKATLMFKLEYYSSDAKEHMQYKDTLIDFIEHKFFDVNIHYEYVLKSHRALDELSEFHIEDIMQVLLDNKINFDVLYEKMFNTASKELMCRNVVRWLITRFVAEFENKLD
jgi:hypothetical protein